MKVSCLVFYLHEGRNIVTTLNFVRGFVSKFGPIEDKAN